MYPAHIRYDNDHKIIQSVRDHCHATAKYAGDALKDVNLSSVASLAGLLHDMGKTKKLFSDYLEQAESGKKIPRGSVNHTFAGVRYVLERYHADPRFDWYACYTSEIIAYAIGAHHGQFDCIDENHDSGFEHRMTADNIQYEESVQNFLSECMKESSLDQLFDSAKKEFCTFIAPILELYNIKTNPSADPVKFYDEFPFYTGLTARLILSAVIDGDRRDTQEFCENIKFPPIPDPSERQVMWSNCLDRLLLHLNHFPQDTEIQRARRIISDQCAISAEHANNICALNVPTGGAKTLGAFRYAVTCARKFNKSRIIITSPLLSILDQNARAIREAVQDDSMILEHHSNIIHQNNPVNSDKTGDNYSELDPAELLISDWSAPIIITTLVQLLNTLFSGKTSSIRRFHALCNSVIVIDEVQTVPLKMLSLFNLAVNFLTTACNTTVVLCSATQPCLEKVIRPLCRKPYDIIPYQKDLWSVFNRTTIINRGKMALDDIPGFAKEILEQQDSLLIICNRRDEAEHLYSALADDFALHCFHLSASMCKAHREKTLAAIKASLHQHSCKTLCVSTQIIEAGVDISFASVIRLTAGLDSIIQSAGRCNRNGESITPLPVYIVECENEDLKFLREIQYGKDATCSLLLSYDKHPEHYDNSLASDRSVNAYYHQLYESIDRNFNGYQDFCVKHDSSNYSIFSLLSGNVTLADTNIAPVSNKYQLHQAFKLAGDLFEVIDSDTVDLLVPYEEGQTYIRELEKYDIRYDLSKIKSVLEKAKPYIISVYKYQIEALSRESAIIPICSNTLLYLCDNYYDSNTGLKLTANSLFLQI